MPAAAQGPSACRDPVFVLCTSRSGSTLLRFVLDAHPDLACPPELKMPNVLAQLARLWSATDALGGSAAQNGGTGISDAAAAGIRHAMDLMIGPYLARRGKKRYCDKNLNTEPHVETLLAVYPEAKFICLYRHPMDMIASGVEACPWGLSQYGFEPYVAHAPGNSVLALARYWADHVGAILAVEDKFPGKCHRLRYEDLVADPEAVAAGIFGFLGLPPVPGISALAFSRERERTGPGDFKIWNTSQITDDSVGRGWSVPADLIPAPLSETINSLADRLGYIRIDANWGTVHKPADLRVPVEGQALPPKVAESRSGPVPPGSLLVSERLQAGLRRLDDEFIQEWKPYSDGSFLMVALASSSTDDDVWWLVDLAARKVVSGSGNCSEGRGWTISAPVATWEQVIRDGLNLGIAFRRHGMRYRDNGGGGAGSITADNRVSMMSDLLGIITWNPHRTGSPSPVPPPASDHQAGEQLAADDELPPWERARHTPPREADLDAVLWPRAPAEHTPDVPRIARISINPAGQAPSIAAPGEARAQGPAPEVPPFSASVPPRERPRAQSYSQRRPGQAGRGPASARERLHVERALQARRRRRFRIATVCAIALIAAAVITSVALDHGGGGTSVGVNAAQAGFGYSGPYAPVTLNADNSVTMAQPGVTQPVLDVYEDFQCPVCRTFEQGSGAAIQRLADEGKVKVVYYPFTVFDSQPQRANSIRAWAAAKCVPADTWARYHNSLYASQPAQTTADGFGVSLLVRLGRNAGITNPGFAQCVESQQYAIQDLPLSDQIVNSGVSSMLTLKLNGQFLDPRLTSSQLRQQIMSASSGRTTALAQVPPARA
jgi:protein-disulfide isomerase